MSPSSSAKHSCAQRQKEEMSETSRLRLVVRTLGFHPSNHGFESRRRYKQKDLILAVRFFCFCVTRICSAWSGAKSKDKTVRPAKPGCVIPACNALGSNAGRP